MIVSLRIERCSGTSYCCGLHGLDDIVADPFLAQRDDFVDIGSCPDSIGLDMSYDDRFADTAACHLDDFGVRDWSSYGSCWRVVPWSGLVAIDDVRATLVARWIVIGLSLVKLLALLFVGLSLPFEFVSLVSEDSSGNGTDCPSNKGSFGGLVFVVVADNATNYRARYAAYDCTVSGIFLSLGLAYPSRM